MGTSKNPDAKRNKTPLTVQQLQAETDAYWGTVGTSEGGRELGLRPAFLDEDSGIIYLSSYANGDPAPVHLLDGLPDEVVVSRDESGQVIAVKASLSAGFLYKDRYYTREAAVALLQQPTV